MKLFIYTIAAMLLCASQAQAMDNNYGKKEPKIQREVALSEEVANLDAAYQAINQLAQQVTSSIDSQTNARSLQALLNDLTAEKQRMVTAINATRTAIKNATIEYNSQQQLLLACFDLLRKLQELHFAEIESKLYALKPVQVAPSSDESRTREESGARKRRNREIKPARRLELPASIAGLAVDYIQAHQVNEFCCGYNALYNACNLEECCDFANCFSDYTVFKETCLGYLNNEKINPQAGVSQYTLDYLARRGLGLQRSCFLLIDQANRIKPYVERVTISYREGSSLATIDRLTKNEFNRSERELLMTLKDDLNMSTKASDIAHFICCFKTSPESGHAILVSVIQNETGRGLYIFDNANLRITESSPMKRFIDFLCREFNISPRDQFRGPHIPERWPTTPR